MDSGTTPRGGGLHLPLYKRLNKFPSKTCFLEKGARTKNEREKVKSVVGARQEGAQKICLLLTFDREILGGFLKAFFLTARHKFNSSFRPSFDQHGTSLCSIFEMENFAKFFLENGKWTIVAVDFSAGIERSGPWPATRAAHVDPSIRVVTQRVAQREEEKAINYERAICHILAYSFRIVVNIVSFQ